MGLEQLGLAIIWELTSGIALCVGMIFVLAGWIKIAVAVKTERNRRMSLSLCIFSVAVVIVPVLVGIFQELPLSHQDRYVLGERLGVIYDQTCSALSVLLTVISMICVYWDSSAARSAVKTGTITMLSVYVLGFAVYVTTSLH